MMVLRGSKDLELGGHISSFQSSAMLYDVGSITLSVRRMTKMEEILSLYKVMFLQASILAFTEGRLSEGQLDNFRHVSGEGLSLILTLN